MEAAEDIVEFLLQLLPADVMATVYTEEIAVGISKPFVESTSVPEAPVPKSS